MYISVQQTFVWSPGLTVMCCSHEGARPRTCTRNCSWYCTWYIWFSFLVQNDGHYDGHNDGHKDGQLMVLSVVQYQVQSLVQSVVHVVILKRDVIKIKQQALINYVTIVLISSDRLFRFFRAQPIGTSNACHVPCSATGMQSWWRAGKAGRVPRGAAVWQSSRSRRR